MSNANKTVEGMEFLQSLRLLATAYEEISVIKMQRTKSSVLANREYITQLSGVFYDVKVNYDAARKAQEQQKGKISPFLVKHQFKTANKNGKTVSVFISSRERLYGDIIKKIFHMFQFQVFLLGTKKAASDVVIVGKYGKQLVDELQNPPKYQFFDLPDTNISPEQILPLTKILNEYETVNVFYGKLENVMIQNATVAHISGDQPMEQTNKNLPHEHYFFEPSLEGVMEFFQTQVFNSLFYQTLHETELARLASRIKAMEEALSNIDRNEKLMKQESRRFKHRQQNKKQLDTLTGISLWKRK